MRTFLYPLSALSLALTACSPRKTPAQPEPPQAVAPAPPKATDPLLARADPINQASLDAPAPPPAPDAGPTETAGKSPDNLLIRTQVILDRLRFSPGVVDGLDGENFHHALAAFQSAHGLDASGQLDAATWKALSSAPEAAKPVMQTYTVTPEDAQGPYAPDVGEDLMKLAALPDGPQYTSPLEALAERFHMSQTLLTSLNPEADLSKPGTRILVADAAPAPFQKGEVAAIEVSKDKAQVTAMNQEGAVIAAYPATVGSTGRPSPSGLHKVVGVAKAPDYVYDPAKLTWGPKSRGKLVIKPGPNGPVGVVWIDLNAPSYGIHGSPNPETIGKTASHGCVRLTNWDAEALAAGVKPGVPVTFEGKRPAKKTKA